MAYSYDTVISFIPRIDHQKKKSMDTQQSHCQIVEQTNMNRMNEVNRGNE